MRSSQLVDDAVPARGSWSTKNRTVIRALRWIAKKGCITARELVDWDEGPGERQLFTWDDPLAATAYRLVQARLFLNSFRGFALPGMRVRKFTNLPEDGVAGSNRAYFGVAAISTRPELRGAVIADLTMRMATLAGELRFWKLTAKERGTIIRRISEALGAE